MPTNQNYRRDPMRLRHADRVVAVRRGELERTFEEARVVEELAGDFEGVPGRREARELKHPPRRRVWPA